MKLPSFLLKHTAKIEDYEGDSGFGDEYGDEYTVKCRVEYKRQLVRDREGNEVTAEGTMFLPPAYNPPPESKVTLPDFGDAEHDIITTAPQDNPFSGQRSHVEVAFK